MSEFSNGFAREEKESKYSKIGPGLHRCAIAGVEETVSKKSGLPMLVLELVPSNSDIKVKHYIVKNDHYNRNMTQFFDAFPSIAFGNFNTISWIGAVGAANFGLDENGYLKVRWFVLPDQVQDLPQFVGNVPKQQQVEVLFPGDDDAPPSFQEPLGDEGLPF